MVWWGLRSVRVWSQAGFVLVRMVEICLHIEFTLQGNVISFVKFMCFTKEMLLLTL